MGADHRLLVLLAGASGYIGGRLLKEWEKAGWLFAAWLDDLTFSDQKLQLPRKSLKLIDGIAVH